MTTVLLADDQAMVRGGFRMIIDAVPGLAVVGEAADGTEAVALARQLDPDIVLMDIRMPGVDGIEATRRLTRAGSRSRVLMLTTFDLDEHVYDSFRAGASGFLLKNAPPEQLVAAIRTVAGLTQPPPQLNGQDRPGTQLLTGLPRQGRPTDLARPACRPDHDTIAPDHGALCPRCCRRPMTCPAAHRHQALKVTPRSCQPADGYQSCRISLLLLNTVAVRHPFYPEMS